MEWVQRVTGGNIAADRRSLESGFVLPVSAPRIAEFALERPAGSRKDFRRS